MRYPTLGMEVPVAFVLSYDVQLSEIGHPQMAATHLQSGLHQFSSTWMNGVCATLSAKLAKKLVIVGGLEQRYPEKRVSRPETIRWIATVFGAEGSKIDCVLSQPNTVGNAEAIAKWCSEHPDDRTDAIIVCAYWHVARASLDLRMQGIDFPVIPAEAVWLASCNKSPSRREAIAILAEYWGKSDFAIRAAWECNGIADKLCRAYLPLSERTDTGVAATQ